MSVLELAFRIGIAGVFWTSGMTKTSTWEQTVALFRDEYKVPILSPEVAAYLATTTELACAVLLAVGIAARFGAAALLGMTLVIQVFVYPANWLVHLLLRRCEQLDRRQAQGEHRAASEGNGE